jgi:hypothetical protein
LAYAEEKDDSMNINLADWFMILLCFSMACAIGGGLYEHIVLTPIWSASPPASFAIIQPGTGVPLQRFWIPVHAAITIFVILSLTLTWRHAEVRRLLLIGLGSYVVMRETDHPPFVPRGARMARHYHLTHKPYVHLRSTQVSPNDKYLRLQAAWLT